MHLACARLVNALAFVASVGLVTACGADKGDGKGNPNDPSKTGDGGLGEFPDDFQPHPNDKDPNADPVGGVCKQENFDLARLPPDVIIVLDRSGSMQRDNPTRWSATTGALDQVIQQTQSTVSWGLQLYPTCQANGQSVNNQPECLPTPCTVEGGYQAPALDQHSALNGLIADSTPVLNTGATPTAAAVAKATAALKAITTPNPKFILLATDGEPNCRNFPPNQTYGPGGNDQEGTVEAVKAAVEDGFPVFVVGIATQGTSADNALNAAAEAGGRARDGNIKYYPASSRDDLVATIGNIAGQVQDCTFQLGAPPPSPTDVAVNIDGKRVERSSWQYGPGNRSIVITGDWCAKLRSGDAMKAEFIFGCPGIPIL